MTRFSLAILALLLFLTPALAAPEADHVFQSILPGYNGRARQLERSEAKADRKKAKVIAKLVSRGEEPRPTLRDELEFAVRVEKKLRKKLADEIYTPVSFDWAMDELDRLVAMTCRRAGTWADSLPVSNDLVRARKKLAKADARYALADEATSMKSRVRQLEKACKYLEKAEKRLAKLGPRPDPVAFLLNPGFEEGTDDDPAEWLAGAPGHRAIWEPVGAGYDGGRCVSTGSTTAELQYTWSTSIRDLIPGHDYNVSARIRGEDVVVHDPEPHKKRGVDVDYCPDSWNISSISIRVDSTQCSTTRAVEWVPSDCVMEHRSSGS